MDLWTRPPPSTKLLERKVQLLQSHVLTANQTYDFSGTLREGYISSALLTTVRIIQCDESELQTLVSRMSSEESPKMISVRNEMATYTSLREIVQFKMRPEQAEVGTMLTDTMTQMIAVGTE